ncbi:excisionase family DNA-binding protein [Chloroflexota bacterium]
MALKDKYLTISQAAKELKVTRQTISRWTAKKYVPVERVGRVALIKREDLHKYHMRRLSEAATDSIMELYTVVVGDVLREAGRMKPDLHVEFPNDEDENIIHLSGEERAKVGQKMKPLLVEILKEFDSKMKDNLPKDKQGGKKTK